MAKRWYPVTDSAVCIECGTCVLNCPHGVYNEKKAPVPVVMAPRHVRGSPPWVRKPLPCRRDHVRWRRYRLDASRYASA
ncbi:MAG: 4Fe-4S binding protein [Eubacteriales bacterium]|nr:4Fe-4S binding protein [Eubacteriales bacterium]